MKGISLKISTLQVIRWFLLLVFAAFGLVGAHPVYAQEPGGLNPDQSTFLYLPVITFGCQNCYFVDSIGGSDTNSGASDTKPWRTLARVNATAFAPGNVVHFKRGSSWTGLLDIENSGVEGRPITFKAYGTGARPIFRNPGAANNLTRAVIIDASWIIVEGLLVRDTFDAGMKILPGANHNIVRDTEITNTGLGIQINGQYNLFTGNHVHDLHMVVNTPGGSDDYGAAGVALINGSFNEISSNRIVNCIAPSYDFVSDGGAVEWYGNSNNNYVHHNWASGNDGFMEVGGGSARDNIVAYNVAYNNSRFSLLHLTGTFQSIVENFRIENNTIVENGSNSLNWAILDFDGNPAQNTLIARNNILYMNRHGIAANSSSFTHDHNIYYLTGGAQLGLSLGPAEMIADPMFLNLAVQDFHLRSSSPSINSGVNLGYIRDFDQHPVPVSSIPDIGAFEFQGGQSLSGQTNGSAPTSWQSVQSALTSRLSGQIARYFCPWAVCRR
jgi:hypothetical protein